MAAVGHDRCSPWLNLAGEAGCSARPPAYMATRAIPGRMGRSHSRGPVDDHPRPAHRRRCHQPGYLHRPRSRLHCFGAQRLESEHLAGPDHERAARDYVAAGAWFAAVKLRHVGCVVATGTDVTHIPVRTVHRPVDTTGAGDASYGAFAASDHSATEDQGSVKRLQASWRIGLLRIDRPLRLSWSPGKRLAARGRDANVGCGRLLVSDLNDPLGGWRLRPPMPISSPRLGSTCPDGGRAGTLSNRLRGILSL